VTRTFSTTNIVLDTRRSLRSPTVFAEDLSTDTPESVGLSDAERIQLTNRGLDPKHLRYFGSMRDFTEWLHEVGAVVNRCVVLA
jgi:hypothetical protein